MQEELDFSEPRIRNQANRAARVVTAWVEDSTHHDGRGAPASLPFESEDGPSFTNLVIAHGADVTPRALGNRNSKLPFRHHRYVRL